MTTKPKLIPLEYCRIDRASRLLGCEEVDLLHWGAIGAIELWACFDGENCGAMVIDHGLEHRTIKDMGHENVINNLTSYITIRKIEESSCFAHLQGFWRISLSTIKTMERGWAIRNSAYAIAKDEQDYTVFAVISSRAINPLAGIDASKNPLEELTPSNLWIMREGLELVRDHIHSGKPLPIKPDDAEQAAAAEMAASNDEPATRIIPITLKISSCP